MKKTPTPAETLESERAKVAARKAKYGSVAKKLQPSTPSMTNILPVPSSGKLDDLMQSRTNLKQSKTKLTASRDKFEIVNAAGTKLAVIRKKQLRQSPSSSKYLKSFKNASSEHSPEEFESKYGHLKVIKPSREEALAKLKTSYDGAFA